MRYYVVSLLLFALLFCKEPVSKPEPTAIVVVFSSGKVFGQAGNNRRLLKAGDLLYQGDRIITRKKSRAILQFASNAMARIDSNTEIEIEALQRASNQQKRKTSLRLRKGSIYSKISKSNEEHDYSVKTPTVVAAVRGTEFITEATEDGTGKVAVGEGTVEVANNQGETLSVDAGNKAVIDEQGALEEKKLSLSENRELDTLSKISEMKKENMQRIEDLLEKQKELQKKASNIEGLNKQKDKNSQLLEDQKEKNRQKLEETKDKMKDKHQNLKDKILEKRNDPLKKAREKIDELK